jgi:predicted nucleic acid-binding protein
VEKVGVVEVPMQKIDDALQVATALNSSCEAFLTNDSNLKRVTQLRVLVLDELEL